MSKDTLIHEARRFLQEEDGPTAAEYVIMLSLIVIISMVAITALGSKATSESTDGHSSVSVP